MNFFDKLDATKATGCDSIGSKILKQSSDYLAVVIVAIINQTINNGVFPEGLKHVCVYLVHESGSKKDAHDYRPVSILPTISKIFELHNAHQLHSFWKSRYSSCLS